jgi:hypothetical protein
MLARKQKRELRNARIHARLLIKKAKVQILQRRIGSLIGNHALRENVTKTKGNEVYFCEILTHSTDLFGCSSGVAKYWAKKVQNPHFHPNSNGGARYCTFSAEINFITGISNLQTCNKHS